MTTRSYYGLAYAAKCYRGPKSVNMVLDSGNARKLAENLLKAVNAGENSIDVAVKGTPRKAMASGDKASITVTSAVQKSGRRAASLEQKTRDYLAKLEKEDPARLATILKQVAGHGR